MTGKKNNQVVFYKKPGIDGQRTTYGRLSHVGPMTGHFNDMGSTHDGPKSVTSPMLREDSSSDNFWQTKICRSVRKICHCADHTKIKARFLGRAFCSGVMWSSVFTLMNWALGLSVGLALWYFGLKYFCLCHKELGQFLADGMVQFGNNSHSSEIYLSEAGYRELVLEAYMSNGGLQMNETIIREYHHLGYLDSMPIGGHLLERNATLTKTFNLSMLLNESSDNSSMEKIWSNLYDQQEQRFAQRQDSNIVNASFLKTTTIHPVMLCPLSKLVYDMAWCNKLFPKKSCDSCHILNFFIMLTLLLIIIGGSFGYLALWINKSYSFTREEYERLCATQNLNLQSQILNLRKHPNLKETNDKQVAKLIKSLVDETWIYQERIGRDSSNLKHDSISINQIFKVSNKQLLTKYRRHHKTSKRRHQVPNGIDKNPVKTRAVLERNEMGQSESDTLVIPHTLEEDEVFLFHGTKLHNIPKIVRSGFDLTRARRGLYGRAIYLAESSEKADQYTDYYANRRREHLAMLVVRVSLGRCMCHAEETRYKMKYKQLFRKPKHDTVVAGLRKRFREFLVYNEKQVYPEYVIVYQRTKRGDSNSQRIEQNTTV